MSLEGFIIVGFPKSGQVSLIEYLQKKHPKAVVKKDEIVWNEKGLEIFKQKYGHNPNIRPVLVYRDPVERIWSAYWYFEMDGEKPFRELYTYEEFLHCNRIDGHLGDMNPIRGSNYDKWFKKWEPLNPLIFDFEELKKDPLFPHRNKTEEEKNIKVPEMTNAQMVLTRKLLNDEIGGTF